MREAADKKPTLQRLEREFRKLASECDRAIDGSPPGPVRWSAMGEATAYRAAARAVAAALAEAEA